MKAYSYNEAGVYTGSVECNIDPLETELAGEDIFLLPANTTYTVPLEHNAENQYLVWFDGKWEIKDIIPPEPVTLTSSEKREQAYGLLSNLILWEGKSITVDQANKVFLEYSAEGRLKATEIQALIVSAKTYIRSLYPDEEV